MKTEIKEKIHGELPVVVTLESEEFTPHLAKAAQEISAARDFKGFRKGKATFEVVEREVGKMALLEHALQAIIQKSLAKVLEEHDLQSIATPRIDVQQIAPGNPLVYTAHIPLLPQVTLPDFSTINVVQEKTAVADKDVDDVIKQVQKSRSKEKLVLRPAQKGDRVKVDISMSVNNVPVEGGTVKGHLLPLGEEFVVPGVSEQVIGMSGGEERTFTIPFPHEFHNKDLAGREVGITAKTHEVFEVELPEIDDAFAKTLGDFEGVSDLKAKIKENLEAEHADRARSKAEQEILTKAIEAAVFEEIPRALLDLELDRMMEELKSSVTAQGVAFEQYLQRIKQDESSMRKGMEDGALRRVKVALILRAIAEKEEITISDEEIDAEIEKRYGASKDQPQVAQAIQSDHFRTYLKNLMRTEKALEWIKHQNEKNRH